MRWGSGPFAQNTSAHPGTGPYRIGSADRSAPLRIRICTELLSGSLFRFAGTINEQAGNDTTLLPIVLSKDIVKHTLGNHTSQ
jgi:hypothetical protein